MTSTWACSIIKTKVCFRGEVREVKMLVLCRCKVWMEHSMYIGWVMVLQQLEIKLGCVLDVRKPFQEFIFQIDVSET